MIRTTNRGILLTLSEKAQKWRASTPVLRFADSVSRMQDSLLAGEKAAELLLVEDDEVDRMAVRRALVEAGANTRLTEEHDVAGARQALAASDFGCVLVDYSLPDGTGLDVVRAARARALPVVMLTGMDDQATALAALRQGAQDYLIKGRFTAEELAKAIEYAVARSRVRELEHRLEHSERLATIGQLAAGVAHEVNNPLQFLMANTDFIGEKLGLLERSFSAAIGQLREASPALAREFESVLSGHEVAGALSIMQRVGCENRDGLARVRDIVRSLKDFARVSRDEYCALDVNEVLNSVRAMVAGELRSCTEVRMDLGSTRRIAGDANRLTQLFVNLVLNACQASADDRPCCVTLQTRDCGDNVMVAVDDTGVGIEPDVLQRVSAPFFTTKSKGTGTGLGLTLCQEIAAEHGGTLSIDSALGRGTRVELVLPALDRADLVAQITSSPPQAPVARPVAPQHRARVLIVDDEPHIGRALVQMLSTTHDVVYAEGGHAALAMLKSGAPFDCVVCDLMMPDLDGPELQRLLNEHDPSLGELFVFATGGAVTDRARDFIESTENECLLKPFGKEDLLACIDRAVQRHRSSTSN